MVNNDDDLNISGQFSPPHEPEEPRGFNSGKLDGVIEAEIDSPYSMDTTKGAPDSMMLNQGRSDPNSSNFGYGAQGRLSTNANATNNSATAQAP